MIYEKIRVGVGDVELVSLQPGLLEVDIEFTPSRRGFLEGGRGRGRSFTESGALAYSHKPRWERSDTGNIYALRPFDVFFCTGDEFFSPEHGLWGVHHFEFNCLLGNVNSNDFEFMPLTLHNMSNIEPSPPFLLGRNGIF
jgi:hypothetical protein